MEKLFRMAQTFGQSQLDDQMVARVVDQHDELPVVQDDALSAELLTIVQFHAVSVDQRVDSLESRAFDRVRALAYFETMVPSRANAVRVEAGVVESL